MRPCCKVIERNLQNIMVSSPVTKVLIVFALILSVASAPFALAGTTCRVSNFSGSPAEVCHKKCCKDKFCCTPESKQSQPAQQVPSQRAGHEITAALASIPFSLLFTLPSFEKLFVVRGRAQRGHSLSPLAVTCIRLI